jgi:hypothetical protein
MSLTDHQLNSILKAINLDIVRLEKVYPKMFEEIIKASSLNLRARELHYLISKKVIRAPRPNAEKRLWHRYNLLECLWISIVKELRGFNVALDDIAIMKEYLFQLRIEEVIKSEDEIITELSKEYSTKAAKDLFSAFIAYLRGINKDHVKEFSILAFWLTEILLDGREINMLIYKQGDEYRIVAEGIRGQAHVQDEINGVKGGSYLTINLTKIIESFVELDAKLSGNQGFGILSNDEKKILDTLRSKDFKQISIRRSNTKLSSDNEENIIIDVEKDFDLLEGKAIEVRRMLALNQYSEINIIYRNDKHLFVRSKTRI